MKIPNAIILLVAAVAITSLLGCGREPKLSMEAMTFGPMPVALTFTNEGQQDLILTDVKVNDERSLTTVLRFGQPNSEFRAVTLAQGETISLDCPPKGPVNTVVAYTDQGVKTFNFRE